MQHLLEEVDEVEIGNRNDAIDAGRREGADNRGAQLGSRGWRGGRQRRLPGVSGRHETRPGTGPRGPSRQRGSSSPSTLPPGFRFRRTVVIVIRIVQSPGGTGDRTHFRAGSGPGRGRFGP